MQKINMDNIWVAMDTLTDKQMLQLAEAIKLIKWKEAEEHRLNNVYWFKTTILPILQDFAEGSSSSFAMEQDDKYIIAVSFRNANDIEITGDSLRIKFA